jgi:hypothetical protein
MILAKFLRALGSYFYHVIGWSCMILAAAAVLTVCDGSQNGHLRVGLLDLVSLAIGPAYIVHNARLKNDSKPLIEIYRGVARRLKIGD